MDANDNTIINDAEAFADALGEAVAASRRAAPLL